MFSSQNSQVSQDANYIEDVFSTYLYTGNGSTQTIANGIDLAGKGGLTWTKARSAANRHALVDTARGGSWELASNLTDGNNAIAPATTFGATGYTMNDSATSFNQNGTTYASWTFREQPKFFDVVTYTGNGAAGLPTRSIAHNLGSAPGFVLIKCVTTGYAWVAWHRSVSGNGYLNSTAAFADDGFAISVTSTTVSFGAGNGAVNGNGDTFVMYLFAHNAGGFGLTGTDNVISCGSYTGNGSTTGPVVTLEYEPQWLMIKRTNSVGNWQIIDNMRGMPVGSADAPLRANLSSAETSVQYASPTATGFQLASTSTEVNASGSTYIYIAIRRGPMKVPTTGTSVYATDTRNGTAPNPPTFNSGFPVDWALSRDVSQTWDWVVSQRLTGNFGFEGISTAAQSDLGGDWGAFDFMDGFNKLETVNSNYRSWMFRRAPGAFDVVCYTGTGSVRTVAHNLTVAPELIICKSRSVGDDWPVFAGPLGNPASVSTTLRLNTTQAVASSAFWNNTAPTASVFTLPVGGYGNNNSGENYVSYLFASCPGVSKVGVYTGTGATLTVNCGFTGGARFVMIKRTDSTGEWYVWDTARGMVSGTDPFLRLNSTAAEVNANTVFTVTGGFQVVSTGTGLNASGGTYIFLAIA